MAIDIKRYVDISTTFPSTDSATRTFGGLVFTAATAKTNTGNSEYDALAEKYNNGEVVQLPLGAVELMFGGVEEDGDGNLIYKSDEYRFAEGYYDYNSPSGRFASRLSFVKYDSSLEGNSPVKAFQAVNEKTNMFGSFTFLNVGYSGDSSDSSPVAPTDDQLLHVAEANSNLDTKYLFVVNNVRNSQTADAVVTECKKYSKIRGTHFVSGKTDASAYMPMALLASTDFDGGSVINYMFKQFDFEEPTVTSDYEYKVFNTGNVNFYGRTQTNGETLDFYQRGFNTNGDDTSVYCNEMWFKSACETALINLQISEERIPANEVGVDRVKMEVIDKCGDAVANGMFMAKTASRNDMRNVREIIAHTGGSEYDVGSVDSDILTKGYSVYAYLSDRITRLTNEVIGENLSPNGEKIIVYYVFYGTADSVRFIKGNDILLK